MAATLALTAANASQKVWAKQMIASGERRLNGLWVKGEGFRDYAGEKAISEWSEVVARRLRHLSQFVEVDTLDADLQHAFAALHAMSLDVIGSQKKQTEAMVVFPHNVIQFESASKNSKSIIPKCKSQSKAKSTNPPFDGGWRGQKCPEQ